MAKGKQTKGKTVRVQFDSSALKASDVKAINRAIQGAVLSEIAKLDLLTDAEARLSLPGRTRGIWIDFPNKRPFD